MPQLDFSTWIGQIFWLVFTFAVMYILMTILVLPRMRNISVRREQKISGDLKRAEELSAEAKSIVKDAQQTLSNAQSEADAILAKAVQDAHQSTDTQVAEATKKIDARVSEALESVEKQKTDALKSLDSMVIEVAADTLNRMGAVQDAKTAVQARVLKKS